MRFFVYALSYDGDAVDDPVEFCLEAIEDLGEGDFDDALEKAPAVRILCLTARRSPALLVRASAYRALRRLLARDAVHYRTPPLEAAPEDFAANLDRLRTLSAESRASGWVNTENFERYLTLIRYFSKVTLFDAAEALEVLQALVSSASVAPSDGEILTALRASLDLVVIPTFFLTPVAGLGDHKSEIVRQEAIDSLFLFPWEAVKGPLAANLEFNPMLRSPQDRIHILCALKVIADRPETIGLKVLRHVAEGLKYVDPGVMYHSMDLFRTMTGLDEDDPAFWQAWWEDYLLKHAGDSS